LADILVVDDDQAVATAFEQFLTFDGHTCRLANSATSAIQMIEERAPNLVMMDIRMPGMDGLTALSQLRERFPGIYVVMMTAYGTSQTSIDAIRAGAFDYLTKPMDLEELREVIAKALAAQEAAGSAAVADAEPVPPVTLVGETPAMLEVYKMIGRLATNSVPALILGERGTGKHLVVATIHDNSTRRDEPLVWLPSGTVTEAELVAALSAEPGGTVALTDVNLLSAPLQSLLAQSLSAAARLRGPIKVNARVVATSERELSDAVRDGFSQALFDELAVITLRMAPLRERREDIPLLVRHFVHRFNAELSRSLKGVEPHVGRLLQSHAWPGNVAELERAIKRACIVARSDVITADDLGGTLAEDRFETPHDVDTALERAVREALHERLVTARAPAPSPYHQIIDIVETTLVGEALVITNGNQVKAADILGVNRATLRKKMPVEP
jgi:two-component system nitrogen regulation response regulator GlnG